MAFLRYNGWGVPQLRSLPRRPERFWPKSATVPSLVARAIYVPIIFGILVGLYHFVHFMHDPWDWPSEFLYPMSLECQLGCILILVLCAARGIVHRGSNPFLPLESRFLVQVFGSSCEEPEKYWVHPCRGTFSCPRRVEFTF